MHQPFTRRPWPALAVVVVGCLALTVGAPVAGGATSAPRESGAEAAASGGTVERRDPPNIILITTDDQNARDMAAMPRTARLLGRDGTTFTQAFSPYPQCCPARASILTGQYPHNHGVMSNLPPWGGFPAFDDTDTLPLWLQAAGYRTAMLGKYLNGYPPDDDRLYIPPGWDRWLAPIKNIYNYRRYTLNDNGVARVVTGRYSTSMVRDEAVSLIEQYAGGAPFFMWAGFLAPHTGPPREPDDPLRRYPGSGLKTPAVQGRYRDSLSYLPLPDKPSINEADVRDKPRFVRGRQKPLVPVRELYQQRLESLRSVDDAVVAMVDALKREGELRDTVLIFTSDNGYLLGEHRQVGKVVGYEESIRVPLIVSGPGFSTGRRTDRLASLVDLAPTIAALAGARPGLVQDGVDLRRVLGRSPDFAQRVILLEALAKRSAAGERWYTGIRSPRHTYLRYDTGERELYNLDADPFQLENRAGTPGTRDLERRYERARRVLADCAGAVCRQSLARLGG